MALFGVQFVISLAVATMLQKFSPFMSLARWILCNGHLVRYLHPSDDDLKSLVGKSSTTNKSKGRRSASDSRKNQINVSSSMGGASKELKTFTVPCNIEVHLEKAVIEEIDLLPQFMYSDYKWLIDFSLSAVVVNILVEMFSFVWPHLYSQELDLSLVWNFMVIWFALKVLFSLTAAYWGGEDTGERSMCLTFGLFFFVVAMIVLVIDESILDFGLDEGYGTFQEKVAAFSKKHSLSSSPAPKWTFKIVLAIGSAVIGAFLGFPGMRSANMHLDSLCYCKETPLMMMLLHVNFIAPLLVILLWIKPITHDPLVTGSWHQVKAPEALLSESGFKHLRYAVLLLFCILRLSLTWRHLQSYLDMAHEKIEKMKRESGRITNVELQRKVARVFYYLSAATLQYVSPAVLILFSTLILRTLGSSSWNSNPVDVSRLHYSSFISNSTKEAALDLRGVLTPVLFEAIASYAVWWLCTAWFMTSLFGVVYLKVFER